MSYFGEINEPSTRTAWEDWDDVMLQESCPKLHLVKKIEPPAEIDTFLILEGRYLYDYIKTQNELEHVNSIPQVNLHLYKAKATNNYICIIKDYSLVASSEIVESIKEYITRSNDVIAVLIKPLVEYQVAQLVPEEYVIRSLLTSVKIKRSKELSFSSLEQPNIITGVAAGALSWREIIDKPGVALVCYIEYPEEEQIHELQKILEQFKVIPHAENVKRNNVLCSNLYI